MSPSRSARPWRWICAVIAILVIAGLFSWRRRKPDAVTLRRQTSVVVRLELPRESRRAANTTEEIGRNAASYFRRTM